jgi:hypothetical protein
MKYYKLDGKTLVPCDLIEWAEMFQKDNRHVGLDMVYGMRVSTVFLGMNHNTGPGDPLLFETMVFVGRSGNDELMLRYSTYDEAEAGHKGIVTLIKRHPFALAVLPWTRFILGWIRRKALKLGNKILSWMWPMVVEMRAEIAKIKAKLK